MGTTPRKPSKPTNRKNARIVSFDDAKRTAVKRRSRKEMSIARGVEREGALSMRSEEEIEAEARAKEESLKLEKAKKSKVASFSAKMRANREERKRARNKAKAEKKFEAAYGDGSGSNGPKGLKGLKGSKGAKAASQGQQSEGGPRAAIYEGKMGSSHKKSAKMQAKAAGSHIAGKASKFSMPSVKLPKMSKALSRTLATVGIVALFAVALYGPAQEYYQQMRETDRLQSEYLAVAARNNTLQSTIDSLTSDEGIEDKAHTDLGYIKQGEQTASVRGANIIDTTEFSSNVAPGSVSAPETWYSPFLDVLFGYSS